MILRTLALAAAIALLTACGFLFFPGHTFLQADTQIYIPILEHLRDPSLYIKDPVALHQHVTYTIYDEVALAIRAITGQPFYFALAAQQLLYRALGIFGMFLIGRALHLNWRLSLLLASIYGLGATINGPAILTFEYEPVPRAYALQLVILAIGLLANHRWTLAGVACGLGYLYHPPTTFPFLFGLGLYTILRRQFRPWIPIVAAAFLGWVISKFQAGEPEKQQLFTLLDPKLEAMQRLRGAYNWFSLWPVQFVRHYQFLFLLGAAAFVRIRTKIPPILQLFFVALPIYGIVCVLANWYFLEHVKWAFMSQWQPARAVLFVELCAATMAITAGIHAAASRRWIESFLWFLPAFAIPQQADVLQLLFPDVRDPIQVTRWLIAASLAILAYFAIRNRFAWAAVLALPFFLIPTIGKVQNYGPLHHPDVYELADWARASTGKDEVFVFPDAGRELYPGLFRVSALRALYVDWKGGGQVNLLHTFAYQWWDRWNKAAGEVYDPAKLTHLADYGIDYFILKRSHKLPDRQPIHENALYVVYRTR